jgi:hypothetical protein
LSIPAHWHDSRQYLPAPGAGASDANDLPRFDPERDLHLALADEDLLHKANPFGYGLHLGGHG